MKKITIALLAVFFLGMANINAQTEVETTTEITEVKVDCPFTVDAEGKKICTKTGKVCDATCENKKNGTCCKGEKKKSCSKSKKGEFDYGTTNDYSGEKSSCSKKEKKKKCCSKNGGEKKGCSKKTETKE